MKEDKLAFTLTNREIAQISEFLENALSDKGLSRRARLRILLSVEEVLLRLREKSGEDARAVIRVSTYFRRSEIRLEVAGETYNPLGESENEWDNLSGSLLTEIGFYPYYVYANGRNTIIIHIPEKKFNPALVLLAAIAVGVFFGCLGYSLIPEPARNVITKSYMEPFEDAWFLLLNLISGPVILLLVITTVETLGRIVNRGASGKGIVARYFLISMAIAVFTVFMTVRMISLPLVGEDIDHSRIAGLLNALVDTIPYSFVDAFTGSNTPQLIILGMVTGNALLLGGDRVKHLKELTQEAYSLGMILTEWVGRMSPFFAAFLLIMDIWNGSFQIFLGIWKLLVISAALTGAFITVLIFHVCMAKQIPISVLLGKVSESFKTAFCTGSLDASFELAEECCVKELGIDKELTKAELPIGLILYMPVTSVGILVFIIYAAVFYRLEVSPLWILTAVVQSVVLFVATPPVAGANLLAYAAVFAELKIPYEALISAVIFDILFGILASASNQLALQLDMVLQADRLGLLNNEVLHHYEPKKK